MDIIRWLILLACLGVAGYEIVTLIISIMHKKKLKELSALTQETIKKEEKDSERHSD